MTKVIDLSIVERKIKNSDLYTIPACQRGNGTMIESEGPLPRWARFASSIPRMMASHQDKW